MFDPSPTIVPPLPERRPRRKRGDVPVVGLTGGVGGGKSAATAMLGERGAIVIDADAVGHEALRRPEVFERLVDRFGPGVLAEVGPGGEAAVATIDRRALGKIVFADTSARRDLEAIVHPVMIADFERSIAEAQRDGAAPAVVLDAAILLESGWDQECDVVVFVDAPREERRARVERTRGWSRADFEAREAAQMPCDAKRRRADYVLPNVAGMAELAVEVDRFCEWLSVLAPPEDARRAPGPLDATGMRAGAS